MRISWILNEKNETLKINKAKYIKVIDNDYILEIDVWDLHQKDLIFIIS